MPAETAEEIANELHGLPPPLLKKVLEFARQLRANNGSNGDTEADHPLLADEGMSDYLSTLCDYEERLERGEITWQ